MKERLPGNVEEMYPALWERRRVAVPVKVSMLGCLEGGGFRVFVLIGCGSGSFCRLIGHKLGGGEEHELRSSTRWDDDDLERWRSRTSEGRNFPFSPQPFLDFPALVGIPGEGWEALVQQFDSLKVHRRFTATLALPLGV